MEHGNDLSDRLWKGLETSDPAKRPAVRDPVARTRPADAVVRFRPIWFVRAQIVVELVVAMPMEPRALGPEEVSPDAGHGVGRVFRGFLDI